MNQVMRCGELSKHWDAVVSVPVDATLVSLAKPECIVLIPNFL